MLPHPGCSGDDTLYPAHFTAVSVDKQNLGHPVKYFNMCSVCLPASVRGVAHALGLFIF